MQPPCPHLPCCTHTLPPQPSIAGRLCSVVEGGDPAALAEWLSVGAAFDWGMPTEGGNVAVEELVRWGWRERWSWQRMAAALQCLEGEDAAYAGAASPAVSEKVRLIGGFFDE